MQILKIQFLKKRLIKFAIAHLLILIISILLCAWSDNSKTDTLHKKEHLQTEVSLISDQLESLEQKTKEAFEAYKLWQSLNQKGKKRDGLKIDEAKNLLNIIEKHYYLSKPFEVNLSPPQELSNIYKTTTTTVSSSNVDLKFAGLDDEYVLSATDALIKNFPGFVKIKSLTMSRQALIDDNLLKQISAGTFSDIVNGELSFEWRDFKDIVNTDDAKVQK